MHDLRSVVLIRIIKQILNATLFGLSEFGIRVLFGLRNTEDVGASAATSTSKSTIACMSHISENISCSLTSKHCGIKTRACTPTKKIGTRDPTVPYIDTRTQ